MGLFKEVEGEVAIIVQGGVYKQCPLYTRNGYLYAKANGGFVRLYHDGSTTVSRCHLDTLTFEGALYRDALGRLCDASVTGAKALSQPEAGKLIGVVKS